MPIGDTVLSSCAGIVSSRGEAEGSGERRTELLGLSFTRAERLLLCLHYADGLNDEEIAVLLRQSIVEVRSSLQVLVDRVRQAMAA